MFDLWASGHSVLREKVVEHIFVAELSKVLLLDMKLPFETLRAEFDSNGYDIVMEANGYIRHIQLKAMRFGGKRARVDINLALAEKPSGCVLWLVVNEDTLELGPFLWLGGKPGEKLVIPEGPIARHSKGDSTGRKGKRAALRTVSKGKFTRVDDLKDVAKNLFGVSTQQHVDLLLMHLLAQNENIKLPERTLSWDSAAEFAHRIDGYAITDKLGRIYDEWLQTATNHATETGAWEGSVLELWTLLFLRYRKDHLAGGIEPSGEELDILNTLCKQLERKVRSIHSS